MPTSNRKTKGDYGEEAAAGYLAAQGYEILERNYKRFGGEIDIIAEKGGCVAICEVKYRKGLSAGFPRESVTRSKQRSIAKTALAYIGERQLDKPFRFDVIEVFGTEIIEINHIEDAFRD
jgi:putative endonuclease